MSCRAFAAETASESAAPGGGSISAYMGAHLNVKINAASLKDRDTAREICTLAQTIADQAVREEREILEIVNTKIG